MNSAIKRGRPLSDNSKKTSINIRVTEEQRQLIKEKATKEGLSISEYMISKVIKSK